MNSSTAGAKPFSDVAAWPGRILSIRRGRRFVAGLILFMLTVFGLLMVSRSARGAPLLKPEDAVFGFIFGLQIWALILPKGHGYSREGVCGWGDRERPWSEVRRVVFKEDHVEFDFGQRFWWQRQWLLLPTDPYERARFDVTLTQFVPEERIDRTSI